MELQKEITVEISKDLLRSMAHLAEKALSRSIHSLTEFDTLLARNVIEDDKAINSFEIDIDNATFGTLAIHAREMPSDSLRLLLSIQKINPMLERIGDHAVNIAESAETLSRQTKHCPLFEIKPMAELCMGMLHDAITAFFDENRELAEEVLTRDDKIDQLNLSITGEVKEAVMSDRGDLSFETALEIIRVCKNLERIADLASNIAEEAIFSILGKIVKHHAEAVPGDPPQHISNNNSVQYSFSANTCN